MSNPEEPLSQPHLDVQWLASMLGWEDLSLDDIQEGFVLLQALSIIAPKSTELSWYSSTEAFACEDLKARIFQDLVKGLRFIGSVPGDVSEEDVQGVRQGDRDACATLLGALKQEYETRHEQKGGGEEADSSNRTHAKTAVPTIAVEIASEYDSDWYEAAEASFRPAVRWILLFVKAHPDESIVSSVEIDALLEDLNEANGKMIRRTRLIPCLCSGRLYQAAASEACGEASPEYLDHLTACGYLKFKTSLRDSIRDMIADDTPFYESIHCNLIEALIAASWREVSIGNVVEHIRFNIAAEYPYDLEDALVTWTNRCLLELQRGVKAEAELSKASKAPVLAEIDDLGTGLTDGRVVTLMAALYFPKMAGRKIHHTVTSDSRAQNWRCFTAICRDLSDMDITWCPEDLASPDLASAGTSGATRLLYMSIVCQLFRACHRRKRPDGSGAARQLLRPGLAQKDAAIIHDVSDRHTSTKPHDRNSLHVGDLMDVFTSSEPDCIAVAAEDRGFVAKPQTTLKKSALKTKNGERRKSDIPIPQRRKDDDQRQAAKDSSSAGGLNAAEDEEAHSSPVPKRRTKLRDLKGKQGSGGQSEASPSQEHTSTTKSGAGQSGEPANMRSTFDSPLSQNRSTKASVTQTAKVTNLSTPARPPVEQTEENVRPSEAEAATSKAPEASGQTKKILPAEQASPVLFEVRSTAGHLSEAELSDKSVDEHQDVTTLEPARIPQSTKQGAEGNLLLDESEDAPTVVETPLPTKPSKPFSSKTKKTSAKTMRHSKSSDDRLAATTGDYDLSGQKARELQLPTPPTPISQCTVLVASKAQAASHEESPYELNRSGNSSMVVSQGLASSQTALPFNAKVSTEGSTIKPKPASATAVGNERHRRKGPSAGAVFSKNEEPPFVLKTTSESSVKHAPSHVQEQTACRVQDFGLGDMPDFAPRKDSSSAGTPTIESSSAFFPSLSQKHSSRQLPSKSSQKTLELPAIGATSGIRRVSPSNIQRGADSSTYMHVRTVEKDETVVTTWNGNTSVTSPHIADTLVESEASVSDAKSDAGSGTSEVQKARLDQLAQSNARRQASAKRHSPSRQKQVSPVKSDKRSPDEELTGSITEVVDDGRIIVHEMAMSLLVDSDSDEDRSVHSADFTSTGSDESGQRQDANPEHEADRTNRVPSPVPHRARSSIRSRPSSAKSLNSSSVWMPVPVEKAVHRSTSEQTRIEEGEDWTTDDDASLSEVRVEEPVATDVADEGWTTEEEIDASAQPKRKASRGKKKLTTKRTKGVTHRPSTPLTERQRSLSSEKTPAEHHPPTHHAPELTTHAAPTVGISDDPSRPQTRPTSARPSVDGPFPTSAHIAPAAEPIRTLTAPPRTSSRSSIQSASKSRPTTGLQLYPLRESDETSSSEEEYVAITPRERPEVSARLATPQVTTREEEKTLSTTPQGNAEPETEPSQTEVTASHDPLKGQVKAVQKPAERRQEILTKKLETVRRMEAARESEIARIAKAKEEAILQKEEARRLRLETQSRKLEERSKQMAEERAKIRKEKEQELATPPPSRGIRASELPRSVARASPVKEQSNRQLIRNALMHVCLAGAVNEKCQAEVLEDLSATTSNHFMILFHAPSTQTFRGLYSYDPHLDQALKIHPGTQGPDVLDTSSVLTFYKYDSGARTFKAVPTKSFGRSVHAVAIGREWAAKPKEPKVFGKARATAKKLLQC
ncbi:Calmodulin-regulated spectrin-associated protein 1 [Thoreauomyces humboldtii]|nr:Calmodulin-regulated spectrin-associated protein 1 [Thoreauomyces humboldtii]